MTIFACPVRLRLLAPASRLPSPYYPMPPSVQNFSNHTRWYPLYHFIVAPILVFNILYKLADLVRAPDVRSGWEAVVATALFLGIAAARAQVLTVQNRIIQLEETLRLQRVLPADMRADTTRLTRRQLIALRFASDDELPELVRRVHAGDFPTPTDIKKAIRNWRPDDLRA